MPAVHKIITLPNGEELELFYIGTLATALGRTTNAIRKWEIAGVIPDPCFRDENGRRLYTQEQIDIIVQCAEECNIKQGKKMSLTDFSSECHRRFDELHEKYFGGK